MPIPSMALLVMLLLFLACWAPIHLLNIIEDFGVPVSRAMAMGMMITDHCWYTGSDDDRLYPLVFNIDLNDQRFTVGLTTTLPSSWLTS